MARFSRTANLFSALNTPYSTLCISTDWKVPKHPWQPQHRAECLKLPQHSPIYIRYQCLCCRTAQNEPLEDRAIYLRTVQNIPE